MKDIATAIKFARGAAKIAIDRSIKSRNGETDPQLQIYNKLPPEGFDALVSQYGADQVINYIKTMERKNLQNGK